MTYFEQFASELNVKITTDKTGLYTGMCRALAEMVNDVILSDNETLFYLPWAEQKEMVKNRFYSVFPYMKK